MQKNNCINGLIAGILASFMLYSVNLQIMQRPNISVLWYADSIISIICIRSQKLVNTFSNNQLSYYMFSYNFIKR